MDSIFQKVQGLLCSKCREKLCSLCSMRKKKIVTVTKVDSLVSFLEIVNKVSEKIRTRSDDIIVYRGHRRVDYELKPYLFRKDCEKLKDIFKFARVFCTA